MKKIGIAVNDTHNIIPNETHCTYLCSITWWSISSKLTHTLTHNNMPANRIISDKMYVCSVCVLYNATIREHTLNKAPQIHSAHRWRQQRRENCRERASESVRVCRKKNGIKSQFPPGFFFMYVHRDNVCDKTNCGKSDEIHQLVEYSIGKIGNGMHFVASNTKLKV